MIIDGKMSPRISVIVPCYKVEEYLDRCVVSLLNQTLQEIEIILVDDGSPDRVPQMCDEWSTKDSRIKVVHKKNAGLGMARNSGIDVATGEYITFVDSDDYVEQDMYRTMYEFARNDDFDAVYCGMRKERADGSWCHVCNFSEETIIEGDSIPWFYRNMMGSQPGVKKEKLHLMSSCLGIYRRSLFQKYPIAFLSERDVVSEDMVFQVDFLKHVSRVLSIPDIFYSYCLNGSSLTNSYYAEKYFRTKVMRDTLISKMGGSKEDINAANRLFIGYVRRYLLLLAKDNKLSLMKEIINDDIWTELSSSYPYTNLVGYQRWHYYLLSQRWGILLFVFSKFAFLAKKITGHKV